MTTTPKLIPVRGDPREIEPRDGKKFTLEELQEYVGGFIEIRHLPGDLILVMNKEGKILGLPVNDQATVMDLNLAPTDAIVGDVVVCHTDLIE